MDENLTTQARHVMMATERIATGWGHEYIGTEHILFALVEDREKPNRAMRVLVALGIDLAKLAGEVEKFIKKGPNLIPFTQTIPRTPRAKKVLEYAAEEARNHHLKNVSTEYLLMGLLREQDGVAAQVLSNLNLCIEDTREAILSLNDEERNSLPASSPAPVVASEKSLEERTTVALEEISASLKKLASLADVEKWPL